MKIFKNLLLLACLLTIFSLPALADDAVKPARLSPEDRAEIQQIEDYLNGLKTITADYLQIDDQGGMMRGTIMIQRPGKMRVTYDPPSHDFIVADGSMVHIWNDDLKEQTNVEEGASLAEFILRDPVKLSGDVVVTGIKHFPAKLEVTLVQANDPGAGQLTLIFEENPLLLRQWRVVDPQGRTTGVSLENVRYDVTMPAKTFYFQPPGFGRNKNSQIP